MAESKDLPQSKERAADWRERVARGLRRIALLPIRYEVQAAAPPADATDICYVLESDRWLDRLILEDACERRGWRAPDPPGGATGLWSVRSIEGWFARRRLVPRDVAELDAWAARDRALGGRGTVVFVPVSVFFGRAPQREHSWLTVLASEDWGLAGRLRRALGVLIHGRNVLLKIGEPLYVGALAADAANAELAARKAGRLLRVFFQEQRSVTVGPELSHRRLLLDEVLQSPLVTAAVHREVRASAGGERRVRARARKYADEIAADYSYPVVRLLDRAFTWLWNRLYEGVDVRRIETLAEVPAGSEVVYVPCHRSHIDYLLLAYVIYRHGLAPPHIAAGVNLNLPIIGGVLRRGGAFFIRRTFHGNALYTAVFRSYFRLILARGFPIKYFIEGTRSRTGRLLPPKYGLLTMTVQSYIADRQRPVVFVPVYFGYEKLIEGQTFLGELSGAAKRKESLGGLVRSLGALRERFGAVQVSFGKPLALESLLDEVNPDWRDATLDEQFRPEWLSTAVEQLGWQIMTRINEAAVLNSVSLVALVVLSMPKQAIVEAELRAQLELYIEIAKRAPYSERTGQPDRDADGMIAQCERMLWLRRRPHALGDILHMNEREAVLASYYRNNVLHVFVLPALVAAGFINRPELNVARLHALVQQLYPCLRGELFLRLDRAELEDAIDRTIAAMLLLGLLESRAGMLARPAESSERAAQMRLCAEIVQPFVERYYLAIMLLIGMGSGTLSARELVTRCRVASERLALIYTLNSPDLFQAELFTNWIEFLRETKILGETSEGKLDFDELELAELAGALGFVLPARLRQTLLNLVGAVAPRASGDDTRQPTGDEHPVRRSDPESERSRAG